MGGGLFDGRRHLDHQLSGLMGTSHPPIARARPATVYRVTRGVHGAPFGLWYRFQRDPRPPLQKSGTKATAAARVGGSRAAFPFAPAPKNTRASNRAAFARPSSQRFANHASVLLGALNNFENRRVHSPLTTTLGNNYE